MKCLFPNIVDKTEGKLGEVIDKAKALGLWLGTCQGPAFAVHLGIVTEDSP